MNFNLIFLFLAQPFCVSSTYKNRKRLYPNVFQMLSWEQELKSKGSSCGSLSAPLKPRLFSVLSHSRRRKFIEPEVRRLLCGISGSPAWSTASCQRRRSDAGRFCGAGPQTESQLATEPPSKHKQIREN